MISGCVPDGMGRFVAGGNRSHQTELSTINVYVKVGIFIIVSIFLPANAGSGSSKVHVGMDDVSLGGYLLGVLFCAFI